MSMACLVDTTNCIGCRACQVACKQWNSLPAEDAGHQPGTYQNPPTLSAESYCLVKFNEVESAGVPAGLKWVFAKMQCMHCNEPSCASACPVTALTKTPQGPVVYDTNKCIGCRYCVWACPFGVPTAEWDSLAPRIRKCTFCMDRIAKRAPHAPREGFRHAERDEYGGFMPACVEVCPTQALVFGQRDGLIAEAWRRIKAAPRAYMPHVYGEKEAGGTGCLYLSSVPFEKLGFRMDLGDRSYPSYAEAALAAVPGMVLFVGGLLGGLSWLHYRRNKMATDGEEQSP
jgi:formate dehydrogenase iron-sulfur subunit